MREVKTVTVQATVENIIDEVGTIHDRLREVRQILRLVSADLEEGLKSPKANMKKLRADSRTVRIQTHELQGIMEQLVEAFPDIRE